jgi:hypothetical protein
MTSNHYQAMRDTAVAALAIALMGCNSDARISNETQAAPSTQIESAAAPATQTIVVDHAAGTYEASGNVFSYEVSA